MFTNNFDPVAIQIFSLDIRWYSLAYINGIMIGWLLCKKIFIKNSKINEKFDDYITYIIIGIMIGGRLGYVVFYNFNYYINNIFDIKYESNGYFYTYDDDFSSPGQITTIEGAGYYPQAGIHFLTGLKLTF